MNPLLNTVFALYADEDIVNNDGTVIIKKGAMIERQSTNALGKAVFVSRPSVRPLYCKRDRFSYRLW
ncbi:MAG: hypothetical protein ACLR7D_07875 [Lachnospira eligens]